MKILFIGGTGNISAACVRLAVAKGHEVTLLTRGQRPLADFGIEGVASLVGDFRDEAGMQSLLGDQHYDVVAQFLAYDPADVERDLRLFEGRCGQYVFISSASAYQKPLLQSPILETTPLENPYWGYSRNKIACEARCMQAYRARGFPATIVRPSHTYETVIPVAIGGWEDFGIIERMRQGRPVLVHGDGESLWTITHSRDFAIGFIGLLGQPQSLGEAYHITSDEWLTWNHIYDMVGQSAGVDEVQKVHVPREWISRMSPDLRGNLYGDKGASAIFDNIKIKTLVPDFKCEIPFAQGIAETIRWFEAKPERMRVDTASQQRIDEVIASYESHLAQLG